MKKLKHLLIFTLVFTISFYPVKSAINPSANFKIAFIGDSGVRENEFGQVLQLIKNEGANMVIHSGDFDYDSNPENWEAMVTKYLGDRFPYVGTSGNHDNWSRYRLIFNKRFTAMGIPVNLKDGEHSYNYSYAGIYFVASGDGNNLDGSFISSKIKLAPDYTWKICSWHRPAFDYQGGSKADGPTFPNSAYNACQANGAFVVNAHEHSYARTMTLSGDQLQANHPTIGLPSVLTVRGSLNGDKGLTFNVVSGLGGGSISEGGIRGYDIRHNTDNWWGTIFTGTRYCKNTCTKEDKTGQDLTRDINLGTPRDKTKDYGALFITFNVDGNPNKARAYFKTIRPEIIDEFEIYSQNTGNVIVPTPSVVTPTPIASPTPTPVLSVMPITSFADFDRDGTLSLMDIIALLGQIFK